MENVEYEIKKLQSRVKSLEDSFIELSISVEAITQSIVDVFVYNETMTEEEFIGKIKENQSKIINKLIKKSEE